MFMFRLLFLVSFVFVASSLSACGQRVSPVKPEGAVVDTGAY